MSGNDNSTRIVAPITATKAHPQQPARANASGRIWSWAALIVGATIWVLALPTWGMSVFLAPVGLVLTALAARSRRDAIFWVGVGFNAVNTIGFVGFFVALLTGEAGIGFE
jgi:hypothetical protein